MFILLVKWYGIPKAILILEYLLQIEVDWAVILQNSGGHAHCFQAR